MKVKIVQDTPVKKTSSSQIVSVSISLPSTRSSSRKKPSTPTIPPEPPEENIKQFTWISAGFKWNLLEA